MTKNEALKMAIEALSQDEGWFEPEEAIKACKEALEQPEDADLTTHATWIKGYGEGLKRGMEMVKETPHLFIKDYPKENTKVVELALWSEEDEKRADIIGQNGNVGYEELFDEL